MPTAPCRQIIYFNGRRVALGDDLEPIVLFDPAKPGDKILVAVKLLHTVDEKTFAGVNLKIEPNATSTTRPNPDDIRIQCITAANILPALPTPRKDLLPKVEEAVAAIDIKALEAGDQSAFDASLRKSQDILSTLQPVLSQARIDLAGNAHIDAAWLWPRSETIDVVKRTFTTALQLMDEYPGYTYSQSAAQYTAWIAEKYPKMNDEIRKRVKEGRWEIVGGMWVEPDLNLPDGESLVRQLLVGQRYFNQQYGVTARIGWNPDSFGYNWQLPQIYKRSGMDYFVTQKMHWNDTNQLPFRLFWWQSPDGSKVLTYFPTDYVHDNVNPTRISADFAESAQRNPGTAEMLDLYGIGDHGGGPTRAMLDQADHWIAAGATPEGQRPDTYQSGAKPQGSDPQEAKRAEGPTDNSVNGRKEAVPTMRYGTAQQYFSAVEKNLNPDSPTWNYDSIAKGYTPPPASSTGAMGLPTWNDELYFEYHRGVFTTQAQHKRSMRTSEVATLDAEKLASLAWLNGKPYPADQLTENWKKITFNQFHDLAAGSGIGVIYKDAQKDYTEVANSDSLIDQSSLKSINSEISTAATGSQDSAPIIVFNSLAWPRTETVEFSVQPPAPGDGIDVTDSSGKPILYQTEGSDPSNHALAADRWLRLRVLARVTVPAFGYTVIHAKARQYRRASDAKSDLATGEDAKTMTLSNSHLRVVIDKKTGCIISLVSLPANTESIAPNSCANQLQTFADTPKQYDAWNIDPGTLDGHMTPINDVFVVDLDSGRAESDGMLRRAITVIRKWRSSTFTQVISLDAGADTVVIDNDIDWHETHVLLKAAFPLAATGPKATYEIPYGSIERPTTRNNSWEKAKFEVPAQRWADLGDATHGLSLLNDVKFGYDAEGNTLRLTLLRSATWPDEVADKGRQQFRYALYPHAGTWKQAQTVHRGYELNDPLKAEQVFPHTGSLPAEHSWAAVENPNVTLTAIKKAEDSDALIFRMYEWAGEATQVKLHIPPGATNATETNLMEKPEGAALTVSGDTITVPIKPYEILTIQATYPHNAAAN